ncbi:hypothetical protein H2200_012987 [Cladophialophora chaetospira]|uniref:Uncharacterized protein n=1 Tax=Cladophialophora chaetospira TaxID=386627 RepID=A0AA38WWJ7_9EURO|nr:hypothetical protein H2200_012987 [Cladophialophora chaetospira]
MKLLNEKCGEGTVFRRQLQTTKNQFVANNQNRRQLVVGERLQPRFRPSATVQEKRESASAGQQPHRGMPKPAHLLHGPSKESRHLRSLAQTWQTARSELLQLATRLPIKSNLDLGELTKTSALLQIFKHPKELQEWVSENVLSRRFRVSAVHRSFIALIEEEEPTLAHALRWELHGTKPKTAAPWGRYPDGIEVLIQPRRKTGQTAKLQFCWLNHQGQKLELTSCFLSDGAQSLFPEDSRYLFFCPDRIDIRDSLGNSLGLTQTRTITMSRDMMVTAMKRDTVKDEFVKFWDLQIGRPSFFKQNPQHSLTVYSNDCRPLEISSKGVNRMVGALNQKQSIQSTLSSTTQKVIELTVSSTELGPSTVIRSRKVPLRRQRYSPALEDENESTGSSSEDIIPLKAVGFRKPPPEQQRLLQAIRKEHESTSSSSEEMPRKLVRRRKLPSQQQRSSLATREENGSISSSSEEKPPKPGPSRQQRSWPAIGKKSESTSSSSEDIPRKLVGSRKLPSRQQRPSPATEERNESSSSSSEDVPRKVLKPQFNPEIKQTPASSTHDGRGFSYTGAKVDDAVEHIKQTLPMRKADLLWLIDEFLKCEYPNGEEIWIASPVRFPQFSLIWTRMKQFILRPQYKDHPFVPTLQEWIDFGYEVNTDQDKAGRGKKGGHTRCLTAAFRVLRTSVTDKQIFKRPQPHIKAKCIKVLTIARNVNPVILSEDA